MELPAGYYALKKNLVTFKTGMVYNPSVVFALKLFTPSFELMELIFAFIFKKNNIIYLSCYYVLHETCRI